VKAGDIRTKFLKYFGDRSHSVIAGSSLIPKDPTVLLTMAGMLQFKPIFLGLEKPAHSRATTAQKCVRTNDIENVGQTARHHTFFEMLGNFSFGDYFKKEAVAFAWELLTKEFNIDKSRLYIAVYEKDAESEDIWKKDMGVPAGRLIRLGEDNNFWSAGPTGPCGPCSEIYYDLGQEQGCGKKECAPGCDCDRFLEIWNLVFMEFNRDESGTLTPLPKKNIDTGMGLERIASVLQDVKTNFDTDLFREMLKEIRIRSGKDSVITQVSQRVIADHVRAAVHLISDGLTPANEGRNYILRRILRRALLHGKKLGIASPFLNELSQIQIGSDKGFYPELEKNAALIKKTILDEEVSFGRTIEQGASQLEAMIKRASSGIIKGSDAFKLYDTYGFPLELTKEVAKERGFSVDQAGFEKEMGRQKETSRSHASKKFALGKIPQVKGYPSTVFTGYDETETEALVLGTIDGYLILDRSPFYVESGGQDSDRGTIIVEKNALEVSSLIKTAEGVILHGISGDLIPAKGEKVRAAVDKQIRSLISAHHTSTHLLHRALQEVAGSSAQQKGSSVTSEKFRFDFVSGSQIRSEDLKKLEDIVNEKIKEALPVKTEVTSLEEAKKAGAKALFGEKYAGTVRMIRIGDFSLELCGGTHVKNTSEIALFRIVKESAVSAGIRRIEAVSGRAALAYEEARKEEESRKAQEAGQKEKAKLQAAALEKESALKAAELAENRESIGGANFVFGLFRGYDHSILKSMTDIIKSSVPCALVLLSSVAEEDNKVSMVAAASLEAAKRGLSADKLLKAVLSTTGGRGGGKELLAQGGFTDSSKAQEIKRAALEFINKNANPGD